MLTPRRSPSRESLRSLAANNMTTSATQTNSSGPGRSRIRALTFGLVAFMGGASIGVLMEERMKCYLLPDSVPLETTDGGLRKVDHVMVSTSGDLSSTSTTNKKQNLESPSTTASSDSDRVNEPKKPEPKQEEPKTEETPQEKKIHNEGPGKALVENTTSIDFSDNSNFFTDEEEQMALNFNKPACSTPRTNMTNLTCAPRIIIAGVMKCGTNELGSLIAKHPRMKFKFCPPGETCEKKSVQGRWSKTEQAVSLWESSPWWLPYEEKLSRYFERFPDTDGINTVTLDKSPAFLRQGNLPGITKNLMPDVKFVWTVCDPTERVVSKFFHYQKSERLMGEYAMPYKERNMTAPKTLDDFAAILNTTHPQCEEHPGKCEELRDNELRLGWYVRDLKNWWKTFDKNEDTMVLNMNDPPTVNAKKLVMFSGLSLKEYPWESLAEEHAAYHNQNYAGREAAWQTNPEAMQVFARLFEGPNEELAEAIGEDYPLHWSSSKFVQ